MFSNTIWTLCFIAFATINIWSVWHFRRTPQPILRWGIRIVGTLTALILTFVSANGVRGLVRLYAPRGTPARSFRVDMAPERVARGEHLTNLMCVNCHSLNRQLPLSGGGNLSDEAHMPLGDLYPINLTPAGPLKDWTDGEIFRAIRQGADKNRRRLPVMSAQRVRNLSDADLESVVAYIRSMPPVQHETPPPRPSFLTTVMAGAGMLPILEGMPPDTIVAPPAGPTLEYGKYMAGWIGCDECHGPQLTGGGGGVLPKGPNLRSVKSWTREGFLATMRAGKTPFGKQLDSTMMPWKVIGRGTDDELSAIYAYLVSLP